MGKYVHLGNPEPLVRLKYNPVQDGFLQSLLLRKCVSCVEIDPVAQTRTAYTFPVDFTRGFECQNCPRCGRRGKRVYTMFGIRAGRRFGKTRVGTLGTILEAQIPYSNHWITAPTYPLLDEFAIPTFFRQLPQELISQGYWKESDRHLWLPNGAEVKFVSLDNPERGRGSGLDTLCLDEAALLAKRAWEVVAPALTDREGAAWAITTPQGGDWTEETFEAPAKAGDEGYWFAEATSLDAPHLSVEYIERRRKSMTPEMFAQEFLAQRVTFTGAIFGDMLERRVIDDTTEAGFAQLRQMIPEWPNIDPSRTGIKGLDPGADHPFGGVSLVSTPYGLVITDEYCERFKTARVHANGIKLMEGAHDPQYAIDRSQLQMQIELAQYGIFATAAENNVVAGIERVKDWAIVNRLWIVKSRCPKLVHQSTRYRWKDTVNTQDESLGQQIPIKKDDDILDALRYALMLWPELPEQFVETVITQSTGPRNLFTLPDKTRNEIERMRRADSVNDDELPAEYAAGEFYG